MPSENSVGPSGGKEEQYNRFVEGIKKEKQTMNLNVGFKDGVLVSAQIVNCNILN